MKRRIILKRKVFHCKKIKISTWIVLIIVLLIFFTYLSLKVISEKITPVIESYAEIETEKIATLIITQTVNNKITSNLDLDELYIINKSDTSTVESIDFNTNIVNNILIEIMTEIQRNLEYLQKGNANELDLPGYDKSLLKKGVIYEVPMGVVFNNSLLSNLGPKIPIKFILIGTINCNLNNDIDSYGINSALIETSIHTSLSIRILLPVSRKDIVITNDLPIAVRIITGEVPKYYLDGYNNSSKVLTLPVE